MGACFGRCFSKVTDFLPYRFYHRHTSMSYQGDERVEFLDGEGDADQHKGSKTLLSYFTLKKFKKKRGIPVTLELLDDGRWSRKGSKYARLNYKNTASTSSGLDTSLQVLDARTLIKQQACVSSSPASSLDLEWEHEGMPLPNLNNEKVESNDSTMPTTDNNSQPSSLTASPWSRVSTPNSLEWDPVEEADLVCVDVETEHLLSEIERLTDRALKETGEWTSNS